MWIKKEKRDKLLESNQKTLNVDHYYMQSKKRIDVQEERNALGNTYLTLIDLNKFILMNVIPHLLKELSV